MAIDLILRGAPIAGASPETPDADIGVQDGRIQVIPPRLEAEGDVINLEGRLVSAGLIESHIHLDKSRILDRSVAAPKGDADHMARVSAVKPGFTVEDVYARARASLEQSLLNGILHMRAHVEVDPNVGMKGSMPSNSSPKIIPGPSIWSFSSSPRKVWSMFQRPTPMWSRG